MPSQLPAVKRPWGVPTALAAIVAVAVLLRMAAAVAMGNQVAPLPGIFDQVSYNTLAGRLLDGHGFTFGQPWWPGTPAGEPTAHWSYLYTGLLAGVYAVTGMLPLAARLLQALACGILFPWLTYRITARVFPGRPAAALLAAAWTAGYIYFVYYAAALMTEALYVAGILWVVDCALRLGEGAAARHSASRAPAAKAAATRAPNLPSQVSVVGHAGRVGNGVTWPDKNHSADRADSPALQPAAPEGRAAALGTPIAAASAAGPRSEELNYASPAPFRLWLELGLAIGLTVLLRQVFMVFVPVLFAWLLWVMVRQGPGRAARLGRLVRGGLVSGAVVALMILPITLYNYRQFGRPVMLNTNAGFAFYWANHPIHGDRFVPILTEDMGSYADMLPPELAGLNQAEMDSALLARGLGFVLEDPTRYLRLSLSRVPVYFMFWPAAASSTFSNLSRVLSFGLALPFMLVGIGLWLRDSVRSGERDPLRRPPAASAQAGVLLLLFAVVYSLVHILSWTLIRYRLPVDAVLLVFAGRALAPVWAGMEALVRRGGAQLNASTTNQ